MTDIPGFLAYLSFGPDDMTVYVRDLSLDRNRAVIKKSHMGGTGVPDQMPAEETGRFTMNGDVDTAGLAVIESHYATPSISAWLQLGDGLGIDAGTYTFSLVPGDYSVTAAADDLWRFSLTGDISGAVTYQLPGG